MFATSKTRDEETQNLLNLIVYHRVIVQTTRSIVNNVGNLAPEFVAIESKRMTSHQIANWSISISIDHDTSRSVKQKTLTFLFRQIDRAHAYVSGSATAQQPLRYLK